jgi:hypothetical protein
MRTTLFGKMWTNFRLNCCRRCIARTVVRVTHNRIGARCPVLWSIAHASKASTYVTISIRIATRALNDIILGIDSWNVRFQEGFEMVNIPKADVTQSRTEGRPHQPNGYL